MKLGITVMSACALSLIGTVGAQETEAPEEQTQEGIPATTHQEEALREIDSDLFERLDQDGDGSISRQEARAESSLSESWSQYDENGDQLLDPDEFSAFDQSSASPADDLEVGQRAPTEEELPATRHQEEVVRDELVEQLDKDGDGAVSQQEAQGEDRLIAEWDQLDRNDNGKLESTELALLEQ